MTANWPLKPAIVNGNASKAGGAMSGKLSEYRTQLRNMLPTLRKQYDVESLSIFGSYIRGTEHPDSDLDVLVTFSRPPSLIRLIEIENQMSDSLRIKVDVVPRTALKPQIGAQILREIVSV